VCAARNDYAEDAVPVSCGEAHSGSTTGATPDAAAGLCGASVESPGVWYRVTGTGTSITVDTCDPTTDFDTQLSVYGGECPRGLTCVAVDDDTCAPQSSVTWESRLGERYFVLVNGAGSLSGEFTLRICCGHTSGIDFDGDGDTDLADLAGFMNCFTGLAGDPGATTLCASADFDHDGRVDWEDFTEFLCVLVAD
jgi:hypothetical protein